MDRRTRQWALGIVATWLAAGVSQGFVREADSTIELQFAGGPPGRWRMVRNALERHAPGTDEWRVAQSEWGTREVLLGNRVALGLLPGTPFPAATLEALRLQPARQINEHLWVLQAPDVASAAQGAQVLANFPGVTVAVPVMKRGLTLHGPYAPRPNDPYFTQQWHLENRDESGERLGPDMLLRAAWAITRGEGITIAICDDGFEVDHPDLAPAAEGAPHFDFNTGQATPESYGDHSTSVAGLAAARGGNRIGVTGVAPGASLASWAIFNRFGAIVSDESLMNAFQNRIQEVPIQNHSWGNGDITLTGPTPLEAAGINNAIDNGRGGLGVIFVRSAGNGRDNSSDVNEDGYANDPRVITVAAVRREGRVASYSNTGTCLLVSAPSGDDSDTFEPSINIFTTDRVGRRGYNQNNYTNDLADYAFLETGFSGTSAAAPQVAGLAALILAVNPGLSYRDVQQIVLHSARHFDLADPAVKTNAAGYVVSHNQGFGVPDAGHAVQLARQWSNRPPLSIVTVSTNTRLAIPDDGLRCWLVEDGAPEISIPCRPALGPHPDEPTQRLPLVFVGLATNAISIDLTGKAALIERGTNFFREKITNAARAGAAFAIVYNHIDGNDIFPMAGTDFVPIPAVMISEDEGRSLVAKLEAGSEISAQLRLETVHHEFVVTNALACEHVGVRIRTNHERRGDLRITLVSPGGTRSILQHANEDSEPGPDNWTYWSVHHMHEPAIGRWQVIFSDQAVEDTGEVLECELLIRGVAIEDSDADGLDDRWEIQWFGNLDSGPRDDPDLDGSPNAREQVLGTDPTRLDAEFRVDVAAHDANSLRLSWPATPHANYQVHVGATADGSDSEIIAIPGRYPEAEWIVPLTPQSRFFKVESVPR